MITVHKFGGKALSDAAGFLRAADIAVSGGSTCFVVVSAISGVTNSLEKIASGVKRGEAVIEDLKQLKKHIEQVSGDLFSSEAFAQDASGYIDELFAFLSSLVRTERSEEAVRVILAQGELISSHLFKLLLQERGADVQYVPALDYMKTDSKGLPDEERIARCLKEAMAGSGTEIFLTEGYVCRNVLNEIDNLGRGGSDWTACLVAAALKADTVDIWTDMQLPENLCHVSYDEAAELGYFGTKILHPASIRPARLAGVPVRVRNINSPEETPSVIDSSLDAGKLKAVVSKDGITVLQVKSSKMLLAHGYLRKIFEIFEGYATSIDVVCTSEIGVSMTIDDDTHLREIASDLERYGVVSVDRNMCLVGVVGDMKWQSTGVQAMVLKALDGIPVRMISYGGSEYNISVILRQQDKAAALASLNAQLTD